MIMAQVHTIRNYDYLKRLRGERWDGGNSRARASLALPTLSLLLFRAGAGGGTEGLVIACRSFRVGGLQLTLYVYVVAAKLDEIA